MSQDNTLAGVNINNIGVGKNKNDVLINITTQFNMAMKRLLILAKKYIEHNDHIEVITKMVSWGDKHIPSQLIHKSYKNLLQSDNKKNIINRNLDFFITKKYNTYIRNDEYKKPLEYIIVTLKEKFNLLTVDEQDYLWDLISIMLICSDEYLKYLTKYKKNIKYN